LKHHLPAIALLGAVAFSAHANTTDWGQHGPLELAAVVTPVGAFEDAYLFELADSTGLFSTAVSNNLNGLLGLTGGMVSLFREAGAVDVALGSFAFDDKTGNISHAFGALAAGDYFYRVTGMGTGSIGGFYTISSAVSPVPEAQTVTLLFSGLGVMGFLALRQRRSQG